MSVENIRIKFNEMKALMLSVMIKNGFPAVKAEICAEVITQSTCDGVLSHGLARFPRLIRQASLGELDVDAEPEFISKKGSIEHLDGNKGIGIYNAMYAAERVTSQANESGLALVSLRNNTHWLRAGTYGWYAAEKGCALICWTNTVPNMPPWGSDKALLGNNPMVIAVPEPEGRHMVLDMAVSQFSYGKLDLYMREGKKLPVDGGFDKEGKLTKDPADILRSGLALPTGYWKGSALSIVLDILGAALSGGSAVAEISKKENDLSQIFLAVSMADPEKNLAGKLIRQLTDQFRNAPGPEGEISRYPGQLVPEMRKQNMKEGIPVPVKLWEKVNAL